MLTSALLFNELADKEFKILQDIVFRECGINLTDRKKTLVQSRLLKRLRDLKLDTYTMYCDYLANNYKEELVNLINCITTNKTDFFREARHFDFLKEVVFPSIEQNGKNSIRIWSAGCSTGEEPYSISIAFAEYFRNKLRPDLKILATDIDTNVLEKAMKGVYSHEENIRGLEEDIIERYFYRGKGSSQNLITVKESIKNIISFRRLNLLDEKFPMKGAFNLIFCRNVIIYFDRQTKDKVISKLFNYLSDDGYFFAGHSESLSGAPDKYYLIGNTIYGKVSKWDQVQQAIK